MVGHGGQFRQPGDNSTVILYSETPEKIMEPLRFVIERALKYTRGTHRYGDLVEGIRSGEFQYWPAKESFVITEFLNFPQRRALNLFLSGGSLDEILKMGPALESFARVTNCDMVILGGRRGWKKVIEKHGFEESWTMFAKNLS